MAIASLHPLESVDRKPLCGKCWFARTDYVAAKGRPLSSVLRAENNQPMIGVVLKSALISSMAP